MKHMNPREKQFYDWYKANNGIELEYEIKMFQLDEGDYKCTYTPDFYCKNSDTYFEVAGTRQAYQQNRNKYEWFKKVYPKIKFKVVKPDGSPYREITSFIRPTFEEFIKRKTSNLRPKHSMPSLVNSKLNEYLARKNMKAVELAKKVGVTPQMIYMIRRDKCRPSPKVADRISRITGIRLRDLLLPEDRKSA